jgi:ectoine hydroxylase-related dioxygenase (phytanoyl-CoA dioxygenase family)
MAHISNERLARDIDTLLRDGVVIMRNLVPLDTIAALERSVDEEYRWLQDNDPVGLKYFNPMLASPSHVSFLFPLKHPCVGANVLFADRPLALTRAYLGADCFLYVCEVNVAFAGGSTDQRPHPDEPHDELGPVGLAWNLAISSCGPHNGMTRLWPGTHLRHLEFGDVPDGDAGQFQPVLGPGDLLIRDLAVVHKGVANPSGQDRFLISLNFFKAVRAPEIPEYLCGIDEKIGLDDEQRQLLRWQPVIPGGIVHAKRYPDLSKYK